MSLLNFKSCFALVLLLLTVQPQANAGQMDKVKTLKGNRDMFLSGMGMAKQHQQDFYLGALYIGDPQRRPEALEGIGIDKRMEIRIVSEGVTSRSFNRYWGYLMRMNNSAEKLKKQAKNIKKFYSFFKEGLDHRDTVYFEVDTKDRTLIAINGKVVGEIENPDFYPVLLNTWIGVKGPSEKFKQGVIGGNSNEDALNLMTAYQSLEVSSSSLVSKDD